MKAVHVTGRAGQSLIELLVAMGILAIMMPALLTGFVASREGRVQQTSRIRATTLLAEGQEAVRAVRESGWSFVATNGTYHPVLVNHAWTLASGAETVDDLSRSIIIANVSRNSAGQIVSSGGTVDPSTKSITVSVGWSSMIPSTLSSTFYITRYLDNIVYTQTTQATFDTGIKQSVATTDTNGGAVVLGAGGNGDWCKPEQFILSQMDLPQSGAARDVKAIEGKAFTGTNSGSSGSFVEIGVSDEDPPVLTNLNTIAGYETNDVFIDGNYAYVATADTSKDIVIIDLTTNQEVGYFNDSYWWGTAQGVYVVGNVGYAVIGPKVHTFDLSSKTGVRSELDSVCLSNFFCLAAGYRLQVIGNYAYVAVDWGSAELRLVNVSNPNNISLAGYADVNGASGQEVTVNDTGTRAYLATSQSSSKREVFIINTTNKTGSLPIVGSYETNGMNPKGITVVPGNRAIVVGTGGEEYQVLNTTTESAPVRCGGFNADTGIYGVSSVLESDGQAYSYVVTADASNEFKVILGGPGGAGLNYYPTGVFESATFDAGATTAFNRVSATVTIPASTTLSYQVAVAQAVSGSCSSALFEYVGPDGTSATSYTSAGGPIPFQTTGTYANPGRCFRYRVNFATQDSSQTPVFEDLTINYSP